MMTTYWKYCTMLIGSLAPSASKQDIKPTGKISAAKINEQEKYVEILADNLCGWADPSQRVADAIAQGSFVLYAQDIVPLAPGGKVLGRELLVRMQEEEDLMLPPGAFIPVIEHFNLMPALDAWIVTHLARLHRESRIPGGRIDFINVSSVTLGDMSFRDAAREAINSGGVSAQQLCFEIDEVDALTHKDACCSFVEAIKSLGCRIAVDHFGKGKISFDLFKLLKIDFIKVDGALILGLARSRLALTTVGAIQRVCATVGVQTIAEMVESREIVNQLREIGIGYAQGFHYSAPRSLEQKSLLAHSIS